MRREATLATLAALILAALLVGPGLWQLGELLPGGSRAWSQAWGAWRMLREAPAVQGDVVLAGAPVLLSVRVLEPLFGLASATSLAVWLWLSAGLVSGWLLARRVGANRPAAAATSLALGANPVVLGGLAEGRYEWLLAPALALGLWGAVEPDRRLKWALIGGLGAALTAAFTPLMGLVSTALLALVALSHSARRGGAILALGALGTAAAAWPWAGLEHLPVEEGWLAAWSNPGDLLEPFYAWRETAAPGLALWLIVASGLWRVLARRDREPLLVGLLVALGVGVVLSWGTDLSWGGQTLDLGGRSLPMPAGWLQTAMPVHPLLTWKTALLPAMACGALVLARLEARLAWVALALLGLEALVLEGPAPAVDARVPQAVLQLRGEGPLVDLPIDSEGRGFGHRYLYLQTRHQRPLLSGMAPLRRGLLLNEPLVVLSANAALGESRHAAPRRGVGDVLEGLGVRTVLFHREHLDVGGRVLLDRLFAHAFEAPQRDLVAGVDVYTLPPGELEELDLVGFEDPHEPPLGWQDPEDYLEGWLGD
jgi:hypothetical protein